MAIAAGLAGVGLYSVNETVIGTIVILAGLCVGLTGAFLIAYLERGKRGLVGVAMAGFAEFFGDFLSV